jgi:hypothetical protein
MYEGLIVLSCLVSGWKLEREETSFVQALGAACGRKLGMTEERVAHIALSVPGYLAV